MCTVDSARTCNFREIFYQVVLKGSSLVVKSGIWFIIRDPKLRHDVARCMYNAIPLRSCVIKFAHLTLAWPKSVFLCCLQTYFAHVSKPHQNIQVGEMGVSHDMFLKMIFFWGSVLPKR